MQVAVTHVTRFAFREPVRHSIHDVRLTPRPGEGQRVLSWRLRGSGRRADWTDGHGNGVSTFSVTGAHGEVVIVAEGVYAWEGDAAWLRYPDQDTLPPIYWLRNGGLARHDSTLDAAIADFAGRAGDAGARVPLLHDLMRRVGELVRYRAGVSDVETTALDALRRGEGVRQDQAHVFIACCRRLGIPARYVSGYHYVEGAAPDAGSSNAWAEAHVDGLGWVGFDPVDRQSPAGEYLKLAIGLDYAEAAPVTGRRVGATAGAESTMSVSVTLRRVD